MWLAAARQEMHRYSTNATLLHRICYDKFERTKRTDRIYCALFLHRRGRLQVLDGDTMLSTSTCKLDPFTSDMPMSLTIPCQSTAPADRQRR